jgi:14-3-3 protein epsilon
MAAPDFYEKNLYLARVTEQSERYDETIKYMEDIVKNKKDDLTIEERNLLSAAYKNCVSSRRSAWRSIYGIEVKERTNNSKYLHLVTELKTTLEKELADLCDRMLKLIDNHLVKKASSAESKVFYLKMKGDYYRYLAEFIAGDKHDDVAQKSKDSYQTANDLAKELSFTNPIKLGLALNFSVFHYEVLNDPATACRIANEAFQEGIQHLEIIEDDQYKDSTTILQLLKENIDMWSVDLAHEGGDENMEDA